MLKREFLRRALLIAMLPFAGTAVAGDADFTLTNKTGYDIESVYVVPSKQKNWGKDQLGKRVLNDGKSRDLSFDKNKSECIYDMKIHWVGYGEDETGSGKKSIFARLTRSRFGTTRRPM